MIKRKIADIIRYSLTSIAASISLIVLLGIIIYIFSTGYKGLSPSLITSDYKETLVTIKLEASDNNFTDPLIENTYFVPKYGISLKDSKNDALESTVEIVYIQSGSPFKNAQAKSSSEIYEITTGYRLDVLMGRDESDNIIIASASDGAYQMSLALNDSLYITSLQCKLSGGGIRGSLISTIILIVVTLLIVIPLGVGAAIYLTLYAKENRFKHILEVLIDMTSGIPSIIFGFCGAIIFIPFVSTISNNEGYSLLAGALTLVVLLIPIVIKTSEEALNSVPRRYLEASLALGASKTQTIFKVILPNALKGILSAVFLSIGRIIGESAALIFVIGTQISDEVGLFSQSTSLAVHIWSITRVENPNYTSACAISIIILVLVFTMSMLVKIMAHKFNKMEA